MFLTILLLLFIERNKLQKYFIQEKKWISKSKIKKQLLVSW